MSTRAFSSRQSIDEGTDWNQLAPPVAADGVTLGSGSNWAINSPVGSGFVITPPTIPVPPGNVPPQLKVPLKSPLRSAAVGTQAWRVLPRISLFHSWLQKKKALSFLIGPPRW